MIPMTLADIAAATGGTLHQADPDTLVDGSLSFNTRGVRSGGLFACLQGRSTDGHAFAAQAVKGGAVAVLASRPVDAPAVVVPDVLAALGDIARAVADRYTGTVIALTGSAGKTSTKDILDTVLALHGPSIANERSFNNEIGFPVTVSRVAPDTRYLVLEMGARGKGHIEHLCSLVRPNIATVLGIGSAHVGEFGSREAIAEAKAEIVRALPDDGTAGLYGDDALVRAMTEQTTAPVLTFGTGTDNDVRAENLDLDDRGRPRFTLTYGSQTHPVQLRVHGRHNVINALAAAATALAAGVPFGTVVTGLEAATLSSGGRMEILDRPDGVTIINDAFNASPESVLAALDALNDIAGQHRRKVAVLGEMAELGAEAEAWHRRVAEKVVAANPAHVIALGDLHIHTVIDHIRLGGIDAAHIVADGSLTQDINAKLRQGDVVLVKGANVLGLEAAARDLAGLRLPGGSQVARSVGGDGESVEHSGGVDAGW